MTDNDAHGLSPTLHHAKATLKSALEEACRADIDHANTGELIRVEEVLAIANEAAKQAVSVRRRLSVGSPGQPDDGARASTATTTTTPVTSALRELADTSGTRWSVFEVRPTTSREKPSIRERFRGGWLSFDSDAEIRRLAPIPSGWQALSDAELLQLLEQAEPATRRPGLG